ncbi:MAG: hypothetical protein MJE77_15865 [Proteobacteria bacterium]|nr:hypothetical protein [Pseudomonadota bacterium]
MRFFFYAAGVAVVGAMVGLLLITRGETPARSTAVTSDRAETLEPSEVQRASQTRSQSWRFRRARPRPVSTPESTGGDAVDGTRAAPGEEQLIEDARNRAAARQQSTERNFQAERVDGSWASNAEERISHALAEDSLGHTTMISSECRSTLCRVEVRHNDASSRSHFQLEFLRLVADALPRSAMHRGNEGDGETSVVYLVRDGYRFSPGHRDIVSENLR